MKPDPTAAQAAIDKEAADLTEDDIHTLIAYFRAEREEFARNGAAGKRPSRSALKPQPGQQLAQDEIDSFMASLGGKS